MKAERVILSFLAVIVGLIAAGGAFYLYQMTKVVPDKDNTLTLVPKVSVSPTPDKANLLTIDSPKDEEVVNKKSVTVSGKTRNDATVIVTSEDNDVVVKPASNGNFSVTQSIPSGTTIIYVTAIFPNGDEKTLTRTITFSTEDF
jgi:hypothetical protein